MNIHAHQAGRRIPEPAGGRPVRPDRLPPAKTTRILSSKSPRGLDGFTFFVADVLTGFGPFVAVYLRRRSGRRLDIGLVLTVGGLVALVGQIPGGALVDAARSERLVAGVGHRR